MSPLLVSEKMPNFCHNTINIQTKSLEEFRSFLRKIDQVKQDRNYEKEDFFSFFVNFLSLEILKNESLNNLHIFVIRVDTKWGPYSDWLSDLVNRYRSFVITNAFIESGMEFFGVHVHSFNSQTQKTQLTEEQNAIIDKDIDYDSIDKISDDSLSKIKDGEYFRPMPEGYWNCLSPRLIEFMKKYQLIRLGG